MTILGIDPGISGGIAALTETSAVLWTVKLKDQTERDIYERLLPVCTTGGGVHAFLERVNSSPQMGVVSAFTFGRCYGLLRGLLIACGIPFEEVTPQKWQKELGCRSGGDKNKTKARAQQLWPSLKWIHATADAALISEYGRRVLAQRTSTREAT